MGFEKIKNFLKERDEITNSYCKKKPIIWIFLCIVLGVLGISWIYLFLFFIHLLGHLSFIIHLNPDIILTLMIVFVIVSMPIFWIIAIFLASSILLTIDKFIKRNQPQSEPKEEKPYENI